MGRVLHTLPPRTFLCSSSFKPLGLMSVSSSFSRRGFRSPREQTWLLLRVCASTCAGSGSSRPHLCESCVLLINQFHREPSIWGHLCPGDVPRERVASSFISLLCFTFVIHAFFFHRMKGVLDTLTLYTLENGLITWCVKYILF
jgi:hypothetical protein